MKKDPAANLKGQATLCQPYRAQWERERLARNA